MLGKRKKQFSMPPHKRDSRKMVRKDQTYGAGYNPKAPRPVRPLAYAEKKWHDTSFKFISGSWTAATTDWPTYASVPSLNLIAAGSEGYERDGSRINAYKLNIRGACNVDKHSSTTYNGTIPDTGYFRVLVYIDTQCNGSATSLDLLFEQRPTGQDSFDVYNSLLDNGRIKVLMDKYVRVPEAVVTYDPNDGKFYAPSRIVHFKKTFNLNLPIQYGDQYANLSSVRTNNIGLLVFAGFATGDQCVCSFRTRLRYTDY